MKKIFVVIFIGIISFSFAMACESRKFNVYYLPLEANFYVPPTREYIMQHGITFELNSCNLLVLFNYVMQKDGIEVLPDDNSKLRVMLVDQDNGKEVFITSDKTLLFKQKKYSVDVTIVNNVVKEIVDYIAANKLITGSPIRRPVSRE